MLKKSLILMTTLLILATLTACQTTTQTVLFTLTEFEATVTVSLNEEIVVAGLSYKSPSEIDMTFSEPLCLNGMTVGFVDGEKVVVFGDVEINLNDVENLTINENLISSLYEVLGNFGASEQLIAQSGKINYEGESINGDYIVTFDCDEMKITSISVQDYFYVFT